MNKVKRLTVNEVVKVAPLFKQYHEFYNVDSKIENIVQYLTERIEKEESIIFYVENDQGEFLGFTQLYPLFCSLEMKRIWLLYDLFTIPEARNLGVGTALLNKADELAKKENSAFIMLSTAKDNFTAQKLYEKNGYIRDDAFFVYNKIC